MSARVVPARPEDSLTLVPAAAIDLATRSMKGPGTRPWLFLFGAGVSVLGGCGERSDSAAGAAGRPRAALVMKSLANEFFSTMA